MNGVTCDHCGLARPGELVLVGVAVDRHVTVERELCKPCTEEALRGIGAALVLPAPPNRSGLSGATVLSAFGRAGGPLRSW